MIHDTRFFITLAQETSSDTPKMCNWSPVVTAKRLPSKDHCNLLTAWQFCPITLWMEIPSDWLVGSSRDVAKFHKSMIQLEKMLAMLSYSCPNTFLISHANPVWFNQSLAVLNCCSRCLILLWTSFPVLGTMILFLALAVLVDCQPW